MTANIPSLNVGISSSNYPSQPSGVPVNISGAKGKGKVTKGHKKTPKLPNPKFNPKVQAEIHEEKPLTIQLPKESISDSPPTVALDVSSAARERDLPVNPEKAQPDRTIESANQPKSSLKVKFTQKKRSAVVSTKKLQAAFLKKANRLKKALSKEKIILADEFGGEKGVRYKIDKRVNRELNRFAKEKVFLKLQQFNGDFAAIVGAENESTPTSIKISNSKIAQLDKKIERSYIKMLAYINKIKKNDPEKYARLYVDNNLRLLICQGNERALGTDFCLQNAKAMIDELNLLKNQYRGNQGHDYLDALNVLAVKIRDNPKLWGTLTIQPGLEVSEEIKRVLNLPNQIAYQNEAAKPLPNISIEELLHSQETRKKIGFTLEKLLQASKDDLIANVKKDPLYRVRYNDITPFMMETIDGQTPLDFYLIFNQNLAESKELLKLNSNIETAKRENELTYRIAQLNLAIENRSISLAEAEKQIGDLSSSLEDFIPPDKKLIFLQFETQLLKKEEPLSPNLRTPESGNTPLPWAEELGRRSIRGSVMIRLENPFKYVQKHIPDSNVKPGKDIIPDSKEAIRLQLEELQGKLKKLS